MGYLIIIIAIGAALLIVRSAVNQKHEYTDLLIEIANRLQLDVRDSSASGIQNFRGTINGHTIDLYIEDIPQGKSSVATLVIEIDFFDKNLPNFSIYYPSLISRINRTFKMNEIKTGDEDFDSTILTECADKDHILALLSCRVRALLKEGMLKSFNLNFTVSDHKIKQYIEIDRIRGPEDIMCQINNLLLLADLFKRKGTISELHARKFMNEPLCQARLLLLERLYANGVNFEKNDPLINKALTDTDMHIRFLGAMLIGGEGTDHVKGIYEHASDELKIMIIRHYAARKNDVFLDFVLGKAENEQIRVRTEIADYCGVLQNRKAEPYLLGEMNRTYYGDDQEKDNQYLLHLINALKTCGTINAVKSLYSIKSLTLMRNVDSAIAAIQARCGTGDAGWLSMLQGDEYLGQLSLTDEEEAKGGE